MTAKTVTAADVRAFYRADEKRMARLSPEAQKTVAEGARGKVSPEAIKGFNSKRRTDRRYVVGVSRQAALAHRAEVQARREALRAQGVKVADRGRLPKVANVTEK